MTARLMYGTWPSPIAAADIASGSLRLMQPWIEQHDVYWLEGRPQEQGRVVLMCHARDGRREITPPDFNVRSRAHEYGGGAYCVHRGKVWVVNDTDRQIHRIAPDGEITRITSTEGLRFADLVRDDSRQRLIAICEDHGGAGEPRNTLVAVHDDGRIVTLAEGEDFYSSPALSPDGNALVWLSWSHPQMPWDGTRLWQAHVTPGGDLTQLRHIAGNADVSVFQPRFSPAGVLCFVADESGWWNLYRMTESGPRRLASEPVEFGMAQWVFGMSTYGFTAASRIVCAVKHAGLSGLREIDVDSGAGRTLPCPYTGIEHLHADASGLALLAGNAAEPAGVHLHPADGAPQTLQRSMDISWDPAYVATGEHIAFPTGDGETAYGFLYRPRNPAARDGGPAPLLVKCHGGPTSATDNTLDPRIQFWTSRGFNFLDLNYRGSTGYGRAYRRSLYRRWGLADPEDCVAVADHLVAQGIADPDRLAITGNSAGGFTVLCALTFHPRFRAGASYYGIGDLESAMRDTHKFESRYGDNLLGPYPECRDVYRQRSPLNHVEGLDCPVIVFQGLEDAVVPPNQAERIVAALRHKRLPVAYLTFPGEGHGFRAAATIRRALEAELAFYGGIFRFTPADDLPALDIENLKAR